mgnify:CR=1 FL=1
MDPKKKDSSTMRKNWFDHVRKTRKKMAKQKREPVSHREAMKEASQSWGTEKAKLVKRIAREKRKKIREQNEPSKKTH